MTQPLLLRTEDGKRRCQSVSPVHGEQCEKKRKHVKKDGPPGPVHKAGSLVWGDNGEHRHVSWIDPGLLVGKVVAQPGSLYRLSAEALSDGGSLVDPLRLYLNAPATTKKLGNEPTFVALDEAAEFASKVDQGASAEDVLRDWWYSVAKDEVERTVPKAVEYGSTDLLDIGTMLARTLRRSVTEEEAAELGVFFYLIGKVARWQSAIERGERPSDDTLFDIGVYVRMAQRIRHSGGWPGTEEK